jgi:fermentation-respiration switch protein FrsA (DUF1100 family)
MSRYRNAIKNFLLLFLISILSNSCNKGNVLNSDLMFNISSYRSSFFFVPNKLTDTLYMVPSYVTPNTFTENEVKIQSGSWELPGTLTIPKGNGPFNVVILVQGVGPNDRDVSIGANKPFKDIALGLAAKNIASLRFDKRTKVYARQMSMIPDGFTVREETIDDVMTAVSLLKTYNNLSKIFILGHDLGGMLGPRIASSNEDIYGLIIMGGNSRPLEDVLLEQSANINTDINNELIKTQVENVKSPSLSLDTPASSLPYDIPAKYWLDLRDYNPGLVAHNLDKPIFIIHGTNDIQVTNKDFEGWEKYLNKKDNATLKSYQGLNHIFLEKGNASDDYMTPSHVSENVISDIADWILSS